MQLNPSTFQVSRHLAESQLLPPASSCCFCGSSKRRPVCVVQSSPDVLLLKCEDCGAASSSRLPTMKALSEYYHDYYVHADLQNNNSRVTCDNTERFGRYLANKLHSHSERLSNPLISVLDFGGGDGSIAASMAENLFVSNIKRIEVVVVDHNTTLVKPRDVRISVTRHNKLEDIRHRVFDIVLASAILEHLTQPKETLVQLMEALDTKGIFYARTPYVAPFIKLFNKLGIKWDFLFPAHLHDLGQDFWKLCFEMCMLAVKITVLESKPSIIETSFKENFFRTLAAYSFKAPWYLLGDSYSLVGGWEVFVRKD